MAHIFTPTLVSIFYCTKIIDDKKSQSNEVKESWIFESDVYHGIKFKIIEETIEEKIVIQILNVSNKNIKKVEGDIYLYRKEASKEFSKTSIQSIDFIATNLDESNGAVLAVISVTDRTRHWDGFEIFVREMETNNKVIKNEMIKGASFFRTYFRALNPQTFHDYRIFNIKVSYNLVYFKEKVKLFRSWILYLLKYRVYNVKLTKEKMLDRFRVWTMRIFFFVLICIYFYIWYKGIYEFFEMINDFIDYFMS